VHIQREREAVLFGGDFMRLKEVVYSFTPGQGPLALDDGPTAMPIEPRGFNRTQELISAMTYSKAPSVPHARCTSGPFSDDWSLDCEPHAPALRAN
jgi:aminopeptidase N